MSANAVPRLRISQGAQVALLGAWLVVGLLMYTVPALPGPYDWGPVVTLVAAAAISLSAAVRVDRMALWPILWTLLVAGVAETVGVQTGRPFGRYHYLPAAGPTLPGGLPLSILAAWPLLILPAVGTVERLLPSIRRLPKAALVALLMVAFDLVLDPVAVHRLRMWIWPGGGPYYGVPLSNFVGWFCYSLLCALPFALRRRPLSMPWTVWAVGALILLFIALLGLGTGLTLPFGLGGLLGALLGWLAGRERRLTGR